MARKRKYRFAIVSVLVVQGTFTVEADSPEEAQTRANMLRMGGELMVADHRMATAVLGEGEKLNWHRQTAQMQSIVAQE